KPSLFSGGQQVAVAELVPSQVLRAGNAVAGQRGAQRGRCAVVEENTHQCGSGASRLWAAKANTALICSGPISNHSAISSMLAPASRFSKTVATGSRVPRNTHAPLTLPGMLSTAEHCDQSSAIAKLLCSPVLFYHELGGCVINWRWKHKKRWFPVRLCCARDGSVWFLLPFRTPTTRSDLLRPSAPRAGRFLHPLLRPRRLQDRRFLLRALVPRAGSAGVVCVRRHIAPLPAQPPVPPC